MRHVPVHYQFFSPSISLSFSLTHIHENTAHIHTQMRKRILKHCCLIHVVCVYNNILSQHVSTAPVIVREVYLIIIFFPHKPFYSDRTLSYVSSNLVLRTPFLGSRTTMLYTSQIRMAIHDYRRRHHRPRRVVLSVAI